MSKENKKPTKGQRSRFFSLTTYATDNFDFSLGAQTNIREDYQDYSFTLDMKYNF